MRPPLCRLSLRLSVFCSRSSAGARVAVHVVGCQHAGCLLRQAQPDCPVSCGALYQASRAQLHASWARCVKAARHACKWCNQEIRPVVRQMLLSL